MTAPSSSNLRPKSLTRNPLTPWKRFFDDNINSMIECKQRKASRQEANLQEDTTNIIVSARTNLQQKQLRFASQVSISNTPFEIDLVSEEINRQNSILMGDRDIEAMSAATFHAVSEHCLSVCDRCHSKTLCNNDGGSPIKSSPEHRMWTSKRSKFTYINFEAGKELKECMSIDQDTTRHIFDAGNYETRNSKPRNYLDILNGKIIPGDPPKRTTLQSHTIETPLQTDAPEDIKYLDKEDSSRTTKTCLLFEQLGLQDMQHNEELLKNVDAPVDIKAGGDNPMIRQKEDEHLQCILGREGVNIYRKQYHSLDHVIANDGFSRDDDMGGWMSKNYGRSELHPYINYSNEKTETQKGTGETEENSQVVQKNTNTLHSKGGYKGDVEMTTLGCDGSSKLDISPRSGNVEECVPPYHTVLEMDTKAGGDWHFSDGMDSVLRQSEEITSLDTPLASSSFSQSKEDCCVQKSSSTHDSISSPELQSGVIVSNETQLRSPRFSRSKDQSNADCSLVQEWSSTHESIWSSELQSSIHHLNDTPPIFSQSKEDCCVIEWTASRDSISSSVLKSSISDSNETQSGSPRFSQSKEDCFVVQERPSTHFSICSSELQPSTIVSCETHPRSSTSSQTNKDCPIQEWSSSHDSIFNSELQPFPSNSDEETGTQEKEKGGTEKKEENYYEGKSNTNDSGSPWTFDTSVAVNDPTLSGYFKRQKGKHEDRQQIIDPSRKKPRKRTKYAQPVSSLASSLNGLPHLRIRYSQSRFNTEKNVRNTNDNPGNQLISATENVLVSKKEIENRFETVTDDNLISDRTDVLVDKDNPYDLTTMEKVPFDEDVPQKLLMTSKKNAPYDEGIPENDPEAEMTAMRENGFLKEDSRCHGTSPTSLTRESKSLSNEDLSISSMECLLEQLIQRGTVEKAFVMDLHGTVMAQSKNASISRPDAKAFFDALRGHYMGLMRIEAGGNVYVCFKSADGSMLMGTCKEWVSVSRRGDNAIVVGFSRTKTSGSCTCITEMTELSRVLNGWSL